jgi:tRNA threonylcarbamoyladenosine modification (KEOPS) complex  Pcc1 subunit
LRGVVRVKLRLAYRVKMRNNVASALYRALLPEMSSLPATCRGHVEVVEHALNIVVECTSLSKARAVNNNLIGLIILLLRIVGETSNGGNLA